MVLPSPLRKPLVLCDALPALLLEPLPVREPFFLPEPFFLLPATYVRSVERE